MWGKRRGTQPVPSSAPADPPQVGPGWHPARKGPARIADWTLEEKANAYAALVAITPDQLADEAHTRAFAVLSASYRRLAAEQLGVDYATFGDDAADPSFLARRLGQRLRSGDLPAVEGALALVADEFLADFFVQAYLAACVRVPGMPDPPRWTEEWIWTLPDHPAPPGTWAQAIPRVPDDD
jgi:hypothetical protein